MGMRIMRRSSLTEDTDSGNDRKEDLVGISKNLIMVHPTSDGSAYCQGQNDRMHLDRNGLFVKNNLEVNTNLNVSGISTFAGAWILMLMFMLLVLLL